MVKFLIIRFSSIGDIVLTTPVVRCLKTQNDDFEVHYLTKAKFAPVIEANPYIDKIHTLDNNFSQLIKDLKKEDFNYVIDLHRNIRTFRVKNSLRKLSFSFNKLNIKKWLLVNLKINKLPEIHIVDRYLETVQLFSAENDDKGLDFFINPHDELNISEFPEIHNKPFLIIVTGGGHYTKQIPKDKIIEIINSISAPIVLIGGKEDIEKAHQIEVAVNKKVLNFTGKLNIGQSASLIKHSAMIVTADTGMMHIAAAFKKNILSVWGNTIPEFGMSAYRAGPYSEIFEVKGLSCRPCSKIGYKKCPKEHFNCMNKQDFGQLKNKINNYFNSLTGNN